MFVIGGVRGESAGLHGILTGWNNYARNSEKQDSDLRQEAHDQLVQQQREETKRGTQELEKIRQNIIRQTKLAALGQLRGRIAHELRNPLGAVQNAVFLLKRKLNTEEEKVQHYLMMAEKEIEQSDKIIHDLLSMAGGKQSIKGLASLEPLLRKVWEREFQVGPHHLDIDLVPQPFLLWGDDNQLQQVFRNLIENVIQAMSHGYGQVTITGRHDGGMDTVSIHDAGMGIAAEDRQRIYEPLFSQKSNGHGLGLTICRQMVESHGGTIELAEKGVPGTTLVLQFPRKIIKVGA